MNDKLTSQEEADLKAAVDAVLKSPSPKKLVIAGPGTGKTTLFKQMLTLETGAPDQRIVLTFINNLKNDLEEDLIDLAKVYTLHSYCLGLLYKNPSINTNLSSRFRCCPGLASIIAKDWELIMEKETPKFIGEMRNLSEVNNIPFYLKRGEYYDAVDFDDTVYRVFDSFRSGMTAPEMYDLVLVDEYQDFNRLEAGFINELGKNNSILIAGDDDQALYSQLRHASWDYIRLLNKSEEYEVFKLPFCMRCPKVIVEAVNDIITKARGNQKLEGRINKPYKYYPPVKGDDSTKYPEIINVRTTVQSKNANYIGKYIAQAIEKIDPAEVQKAREDGFPAVLIIVAQPYRDQIYNYLVSVGYHVERRMNTANKINKELGLSILQEDPESNLGWRIILDSDNPPFLKEVITATVNCTLPLTELLPNEYIEKILIESERFEKSEEILEDKDIESEGVNLPQIKITSFEGAKGLSAQHVFIAGLHNGELPHDENNISDLEICKFVVGLTRTRKECTLIHTGHFGKSWKNPSSFISWINPKRLKNIEVDASYWN